MASRSTLVTSLAESQLDFRRRTPPPGSAGGVGEVRRRVHVPKPTTSTWSAPLPSSLPPQRLRRLVEALTASPAEPLDPRGPRRRLRRPRRPAARVERAVNAASAVSPITPHPEHADLLAHDVRVARL